MRIVGAVFRYQTNEIQINICVSFVSFLSLSAYKLVGPFTFKEEEEEDKKQEIEIYKGR